MMMSKANSAAGEFRHEINALRAIAVLGVIVFHFWPDKLPGGYVGVDVFFVISGYLITSQIVLRIDAGRFSFADFYLRRMRRIFPAALVVLGAVLVGVFLISSPLQWRDIAGQITASALFFENWVLAFLSVDYLASSAAPSPVEHYWSLSVEEQFYLVWPGLLLLATLTFARSQRQSGGRIATVGVIALVSLGISILLVQTDSAPAYFNTFGRAWEFAAGGILWLVVRNKVISTRLIPVLASAGWTLVALSFWLLNSSTPFPGMVALLPVVGTLMVIVASSPGETSRWRFVYANPAVTFVAAVSFSAYLWHWPLFVFCADAMNRSPGNFWLLGLFVLTFVLAWITTKYVETPVRRRRLVGGTKSIRPLVIGVSSAVIVGAVGLIPLAIVNLNVAQSHAIPSETNGLRNTVVPGEPSLCVGAEALDPESLCLDGPYLQIVPNPLAPAGPISELIAKGCAATFDEDSYPVCQFGNPDSDVRVAYIGDSHAMTFFPAIEEIANSNNWNLTVYLRGKCAWRLPTGQAPKCDTFREMIRADLTTGEPWSAVISIGTVSSASKNEKDYVELWQPLVARGTKVIVIGDNPHLSDSARECVVAHMPQTEVCVDPRDEAAKPDAQFRAASRMPGAIGIDLTDYFCTKLSCGAVVGGIVVYRDGNHANDEFTVTLAPMIAREIGLRTTGLIDSAGAD